MTYKNLQVLKELKRIQKCNSKNKLSMEEIGNYIYSNNSPGILYYLEEQKLINMNTSNGRQIPFLNAYGNDFIKNNSLIDCFLKDYEWGINIIISGILVGIVGEIIQLLIEHFSK